MNGHFVESERARWHLEQAAILQQIANREIRQGFYTAAEKTQARAQRHRETAARLEKQAHT